MVWFLLWMSSAFAADGLVWTWNDSRPVRYEMTTTVLTPMVQEWMGFKVGEARVYEFMMLMSTTCTGRHQGKRWGVGCTIDSLEIHAKPVGNDADKLQGIIAEYHEFFVGKTVGFSMSDDGRIKKIDFSDVDARDGRAGIVIEQMIKNIARMFVPFDLQMPKDGLDKGKEWRQKGTPLALSMFGSQGTAGGLVMKRRVVGAEDSSVALSMTGRGSVAIGVSPDSGSVPMMLLSCQERSQFDTELGVLNWAEVKRKSTHSASNIGMGAGTVPPTTFHTRIARIGSNIPLSGP